MSHLSTAHSSLVLTTPPSGVPVTLAEAKAQTRATEFTDDDDYLTALIDVATDHIDPAGKGWLGAALLKQTWTLALDRFPCWDAWHQALSSMDGLAIVLPYPPLISVDEIKYYDTAGVQQTLAAASYQVAGIGAWQRARILPAPGIDWPETQSDRVETVTVKFTCGHNAAGDIPASIRHAIKLLIGHFYENREQVVLDPTGRASAIEIPQGIQALLAPLRIYI